jgi:hypothetical protein
MLLRKIFSFPTLTLLVALTLSAIAAWYSILGLTAIFAAAVIPIIIMGGSLEIAKVVTTVWLHRYWDRAGWVLKMYLIPAVIALAFLTSMGIFGFLSKAHSDQELVSGDVGAKVAVYDEKIKTARDNIEANRKALQQMDAQVDQLLGRTTDDVGANRAVQVRRQQRAERTRLQNEIAADQEVIAKLNEEAAPIRAQIRKVEAEVGPIKYIAALIYGDQVQEDTTTLEKAVRWVIILIVFVFDPLALSLVIAAQHSYRWLDDDLRNRKKDDEDEAEEKFKEAFLDSKASVDSEINLEFDEPTEPKKNSIEDEQKEIEKFLEENFDEIVNETVYDEALQEIKDEHVNIIDNDESDETVGETVRKTPVPTDGEADSALVQNEDQTTRDTKSGPAVAPVIRTEGVTLQETDGGYVKFEGKGMSKTALKSLRPDLFLQVDNGNQPSTNFGTQFPKFAKKGDTFVRVDTLPNRVFKFSGEKWIEVSKNNTSSYLYDEEYIRYLVNKIDTGEYDVELLSDDEREQIEEYLRKQTD